MHVSMSNYRWLNHSVLLCWIIVVVPWGRGGRKWSLCRSGDGCVVGWEAVVDGSGEGVCCMLEMNYRVGFGVRGG